MVWAILPLKDLVKAKSRLAGLLAPHERRALAQAMAEDVFACLRHHPGLQGVLVVSDDPSAEMLAHKYSLEWMPEKQLGGSGLNAAVAGTTDVLAARGVEHVMVLHGDLPLLQVGDISALLERYDSSEVDMVIGPDLAGEGTNVMIFPVRARPRFQYGPHSCRAHQEEGRALGHRVALVKSTGIGLDVDSPEDLLLLYRHLRSNDVAFNTSAVLRDERINRRLAALERGEPGATRKEMPRDAV